MAPDPITSSFSNFSGLRFWTACPQASRASRYSLKRSGFAGTDAPPGLGALALSAVVVASRSETAAFKAQEVFQTEHFRVYTNPDVLGVELGGALKNVIAVAAGAA